ncbi:MAG: DUF2490 domain-containing protein [Dinghuibacter sp.]|nr:DUF2490 domain-containing protein [Dinghuibacter sp.]
MQQVKKISTGLVIGALFTIPFGAKAQTEWQSRNMLGVQASVTDKIQLGLSHMRVFNLSDSFSAAFSFTNIQATYELNKKTDISAGVQLLNNAGSSATRTRFFIRGAYTTRVLRKLNWTNALRFELHSKNETRFRQRAGFSTRLALRKRVTPLKLIPSVTYAVFYNMGGSPIRYYDKDAQLLARQTPDGLHRSRFTFDLNAKVNTYLRVSLYYMKQSEFNFLASETRKMNVYDPVRNRTLRPFNNFNAIGLTAQVNLDPIINR